MNNMPPITKNLLIINVLCFFGAIVAQRYGIDSDSILGLHYFSSSNFNMGQFITYMFMHANFQHIFFNMFALWMFGRVLEQVWGPKRFLTYYMICGIGAALIQEGVMALQYTSLTSHMVPDAVDLVFREGADILGEHKNYVDTSLAELNLLLNTPTVGASGAVFGILLAFGMLFPNSEMFIFPLPFPIKAKYFVILYAVLEFILGVSANDNVAHFAHLGGMIFGFFLIIYWKKKYGSGQNFY